MHTNSKEIEMANTKNRKMRLLRSQLALFNPFVPTTFRQGENMAGPGRLGSEEGSENRGIGGFA